MKKLFLFLFASACLAQGPTISGTPVFPSTNIWNVPIDHLPVVHNSGAMVTVIGPANHLGCDDVMPINVIHGAKLPTYTIASGSETDAGPYLIPPNPLVENPNDRNPNVDHHVLVVDLDAGIEYDIYQLTGAPGKYAAYSAAKWDLRSNALRPNGWTSADAAGLPIVPGIARYQEFQEGEIKHALRITFHSGADENYFWPARHYASRDKTPNLPKMGQRLRLKASYDVSGFPPQAKVILNALKKYGAMVADNGRPGLMQHDQGPWDAAQVVTLHKVTMSDMEFIDVSGLMSNPDLGIAVNPPPPGLLVSDKLGRPTPVGFGPGIGILPDGTFGLIPKPGSGH